MRRLLHALMGSALIALLLSTVSPCLVVLHAASAVVQSCYNSSSGTSVSCTLMSVAANNAIVVFCQQDTSTGSLSASDGTNSYTSGLSDLGTSPAIVIAYDLSAASGSPSVQCAGASSFIGVTAIEISGSDTSAIDAISSSANRGTSATAATGNIVTSMTGIVIGAFALRQGGAITPDAAWTQIREDETWTNVAGGSVYKVTSGSMYNHQWSNPSAGWASAAIALKDSGGGGGTVPKGTLLGVFP